MTTNSEVSKVGKTLRASVIVIGVITAYLLIEDLVFLLLYPHVFDSLEFRLFVYIEISLAYSITIIVTLLVAMIRALWLRSERAWLTYMIVLAVVVSLNVLEIVYLRDVIH